MKKYFILQILLMFSVFILLVIGINMCINDIGKEVSKEQKLQESKIGDSVIIAKDTFIVIDYSIMRNTLILNNKTEINSSYKTFNRKRK